MLGRGNRRRRAAEIFLYKKQKECYNFRKEIEKAKETGGKNGSRITQTRNH